MEKEVFEIFADLHPHEAYELDKEMFCDYFRRKTGRNLTDEQIAELVKDSLKC